MMIGNTSNTVSMTYNIVNATNKAIEKTSRALSTGLKAATAADDAAGFAIGLGMSAQVAGVDRAIRNSQDGISMLQTAEGGLSRINSVLQRMRELAVQAANDSLTAQDRSYIQAEIDELCEGINGAAASTTFNGKRLLDGSSTAQWTSDNANTKLKITGAITATDNYGQKKATEGNYRIEIRAKAGKGQVQKSNIIELETLDETISTEKAPKRDSDGNIITDSAGNPVEVSVTISEKRLHPATLENIKSFTNASGVSYFTEPQTIRITQGDGKTASIVVYGGDTVYDVRRKINDAIADDLGQGQYVDNRENFCTISDGTPQTSESASTDNPTLTSHNDINERVYERDADGKLILDEEGNPKRVKTYKLDKNGDIVYDGNGDPVEVSYNAQVKKGAFVIRSAVAGKAGELTFSSDNESLIAALGLNTIQEAEENTFKASVYDAHTGKVLAKNAQTDGNVITGVIHPNANIEFDNMANVKVSWDENSKRYIMDSESAAYETELHIKDKSTAFQIGQGRGEDIYINIGDMRPEALGLNSVDVTTRENASRSISILDAAIHKVSVQRSKLGSYMNELEYNTNSLTQTSLHMQESESRLKDADMALEYMDFVKLQILSNAGNSMLSQANQSASSIMRAINI